MRKTIPINTPVDWRFSDLQLRRTPEGDISFDLDALQAVLVNGKADLDWLMSHHEDYLAELLTHLYAASVEHLGAEDPVVERLIAEIKDE